MRVFLVLRSHTFADHPGRVAAPSSKSFTTIETMKTLIIAALALTAGCNRYVTDAQDTVYNETKLSTSLRKYEWFKDAYNQIQAKDQTISMLAGKIDSLKADYKGQSRKDWAEDDRMAVNKWQAERDGLKASRNSLAAEYTAQMEKVNWKYAGDGRLPRSVEETP